MACRGCFECLLKLLNFVLTVAGLAMVGYGVYLLVEWIKVSSGGGEDPISPVSDNPVMLTLGRPMLLVAPISTSFVDQLPKAWYVFFFCLSEFLVMWACLPMEKDLILMWWKP